jgi:GT2 family glycosyltransferase
MNSQNSQSRISVAAVIVTRDRLALLQESVAAVRAQTRRPDEIIVVNNESSDGTGEWLDAEAAADADFIVIHQGNTGGAGGFNTGIRAAYERGHSWFWVLDDDTIATPTALEKLLEAPPASDSRCGFLASLVRWTDGSPHKMNMVPARDALYNGRPFWYGSVMQDGCVPITRATFVSALIRREAVAKVGLPIKEFFIWCDDIEFTYRISRKFSGYFVLGSEVLHKTKENRGGNIEAVAPGDYGKLCYGLRNHLYFIRQEDGLPVLKQLKIGFFVARTTLQILKRRAPLSLVANLLSGLFFAPRIERVRKDKNKPGARTRSHAAHNSDGISDNAPANGAGGGQVLEGRALSGARAE